MKTEVQVGGDVAPGFEEVRSEFARNFSERGEIGASVAAYWRGRKVVDLWGGRRTPDGDEPWNRDTMVVVQSTVTTARHLSKSTHGLRFEDLVDSPHDTLAEVQGFLGVAERDLLAGFRRPPEKHAVGNKMMFHFTGTLTRDERWRDELSPEEQAQVLALAHPLAGRFGYAA